MHWKKPIAGMVGIFLLAGLLLFIAGELSADSLRGEITSRPLLTDAGSVPDSLDGGGNQPDETSGDPDDVDFTLPLSVWFLRWLLNL